MHTEFVPLPRERHRWEGFGKIVSNVVVRINGSNFEVLHLNTFAYEMVADFDVLGSGMVDWVVGNVLGGFAVLEYFRRLLGEVKFLQGFTKVQSFTSCVCKGNVLGLS